jgi:hypothetical protein
MTSSLREVLAASTATSTHPPLAAIAATTLPPIPPTLDLSSASAKTAVLPGLESIGPVRVLFDSVPLGIPSATTDTAFHPFQGVRIIVPAGAWISADGRRGAAPRELTISVFELPPGLAGAPGAPCGPALDLGPRDQRLARPILFSVPCSNGGAAGTSRRVYALDPASGAWTADAAPNASVSAAAQSTGGDTVGVGEVWAETGSLGSHVGMDVLAAIPVERAGGGMGVVAGWTAGAGGMAVAGVAAVCVARRLRRSQRGFSRGVKVDAEGCGQLVAEDVEAPEGSRGRAPETGAFSGFEGALSAPLAAGKEAPGPQTAVKDDAEDEEQVPAEDSDVETPESLFGLVSRSGLSSGIAVADSTSVDVDAHPFSATAVRKENTMMDDLEAGSASVVARPGKNRV